MAVLSSVNGSILLQDHDCSKPMLEASILFPSLTGNSMEGKSGIKDRHAKAVVRYEKRKQLEREGTAEARAKLQKFPPANPEDLKPLEGRVLCCHPVYLNCPFRLLAAYNTSYGYQYCAFPTREHFINELMDTAVAGKKNLWFPIIEFDTATYWFVDFDEDRSPLPSQSQNEAEFAERCELGMRYLTACAEYLYGIGAYEAAGGTYYLTACSERKFSMHVHFKLGFQNVQALNLVMAFARRWLDEAPRDNPLVRALLSANPKSAQGNQYIIDTIYNGNRNLRCLGQVKFGKTDMLVPWHNGQRLSVSLAREDPKEWRRWVKRSLILLPKDLHKKILCLPDPLLEVPLHKQLEKNPSFALAWKSLLPEEEMPVLDEMPSDLPSIWAALHVLKRNKSLRPDVMDYVRKSGMLEQMTLLFQTGDLLLEQVLRPHFGKDIRKSPPPAQPVPAAPLPSPDAAAAAKGPTVLLMDTLFCRKRVKACGYD
jgi:hypothetical protein